MEEKLKQLVKMMQDIMKNCEDIKKKYDDMANKLDSHQETMKSSQETMKTKLRTEVEMKVQVIEEKVDIVEETATSPKSEIKKDIKKIENKAEDVHEELKIENKGTDSAKANGTTDSNVDTTTAKAEQKPESNDSVKEGEPSGSVAADSSHEVSENEEETTNLQLVWEDLQVAKRIDQKRGEEGKEGLVGALVNSGDVSLGSKNFESATGDIKEGLRMRDEFPASTVEEQQGQDPTKKLQRSREGLYATVTRLSDGVWRIPKRPRVKMRFVRLKLFEGSTDGVT